MTSPRTDRSSRSSSRTRVLSRRSSARSRRKARRSIPCRSRSRPWRTSSSAWWGGDSSERGQGPSLGPSVSDRAEPAGRQGPVLSADRRCEPRAVLDFLRGPPSATRDRRIRVHLSVLRRPGARGDHDQNRGRALGHVRARSVRERGRAIRGRGRRRREHERPRGLGGPWRHDGRILAQRPLVDGEPAVLGEGNREPAALHDGPDEPDGPARRDGGRRDGHDVDAGGLDPGRRRPRVRRRLPGRQPVAAPRRLLCDLDRPLRPRDDVRLVVPALGPRGVEPVRAHGGTDFLLEWVLLSARRPPEDSRMGPGHRDRGFVHSGLARPRRAPPAHARFDGLRRQLLDFQRHDGTGDPRRHGRPVPDPRKILPGVPRDAREARGEADLTASMRTYWRTFKTAAWLGWEMDSNWTEPWLFVLYSVIKPVAGAFILVLMYIVFVAIGRPSGDADAFSYMYVGHSFLTAKHTHGLAEGIPGLFYVFCGVLFPLSVLPSWGQAVGRAIPLTYWFDITRRLIAPTVTVNTTLSGFDPLTILLFLIVSSIGFFLLSVLIHKVGQYFARKAGKIDITTSY